VRRLRQVTMEKVVRELVGDSEAETLQLPVWPSLHEFVLLRVQIDAGEIGFDSSLDTVFGAKIVEGDRVQAEVHFKEGEDVNGCVVFAQDGILRAQILNFLPDVLHARLLMAVSRMEFADVVGKVLEFRLSKFVAASGAKESGKGFLKDGVVRNVSWNFVPLERSFIHKGELSCAGKAEKGGQPFECFDIARRRVDAALDFAPVTRVQTSLFAKISQGKALFQAKGFNGVTEHIYCYFVVKDYHTCQYASMGDNNTVPQRCYICDVELVPIPRGHNGRLQDNHATRDHVPPDGRLSIASLVGADR